MQIHRIDDVELQKGECALYDFSNQSESYASDYGWSLKKEQDCYEYYLDFPEGTSKSVVYTLLPGITLIYFDINASTIPSGPNEYVALNLMHFNYCISGRIELYLDDNSYMYMAENDFSISKQDAGSASFFPSKYFQGITL